MTESIQTFTEAEAVDFLRVKWYTLRDARLRGKLSFSRIVMNRVRYTRADREAYLERTHIPVAESVAITTDEIN